MRKIFSFFLLISFSLTQAQELNCVVKVNADKVGGTNMQVYKTLEKSLNDFVNKTSWTDQSYKPTEKINCSMFISITAFTADQYTATIQVQSSRPVFNSTYSSPVFNYNDKDFNFAYTEFQNFTYNPNSFDSNIVSVMAFYSLLIIGMDADTFSLNGGTANLEAAQDVASVAQSGGYKGWSQGDGSQNRYFLITDMLSNTYGAFREAMYQYHIEGMDGMNKDLKMSKIKIKDAITTIGNLHTVRPNAFLTRVFFDAKSDEIVSIFSGGPTIPIADLVENLNKISPLNSAKWTGIKF